MGYSNDGSSYAASVYASSLHPAPEPMTRANSGSDSDPEPLVTPLDELPPSAKRHSAPASPYAKHGMGPRVMAASRARDEADTARDVEVLGSYFASPKTRSPSIALMHKPSAKALISRYESLTPSPTARSTSVLRKHASQPPPASRIERTLSAASEDVGYTSGKEKDKREKGNSPIRRSIRNFLAVFKKPSSQPRIEAFGVPSMRYPSPTSLVLSPKTTPKVPDDPLSLTMDLTGDLPLGSPAPLHAGPVLYLSREGLGDASNRANKQMYPVWTRCTATLFANSIRLTAQSASIASALSTAALPLTVSIDLAGASDVRSVPPGDIEPEIAALLPNGGDGALGQKVWMITFVGSPRQLFAVGGVQERAIWVSMVWNAVLQTQVDDDTSDGVKYPRSEVEDDEKAGNPETLRRQNAVLDLTTYFDGSRRPASSSRHQLLPSITERSLPPATERSLPPTPRSTSPAPPSPPPSASTRTSSVEHTRIQLHDAPVRRTTISSHSSKGSNGTLQSPYSRLASPARDMRSLSPSSISPSEDRASSRSACSSSSSPSRPSSRSSTDITSPLPLPPSGRLTSTKSPSIRTLSAKSVVSQRLAAIERQSKGQLDDPEDLRSVSPSRASLSARTEATRKLLNPIDLPVSRDPPWVTALRARPSVSSRMERLRTAFEDIERLERMHSFRSGASTPKAAISGGSSPSHFSGGLNLLTEKNVAEMDKPYVLAAGEAATPSTPSCYTPIPRAILEMEGNHAVVPDPPQPQPRSEGLEKMHEALNVKLTGIEDNVRTLPEHVHTAIAQNRPDHSHVFRGLEVLGDALDELGTHSVDVRTDVSRVQRAVDGMASFMAERREGEAQARTELAGSVQHINNDLEQKLPEIIKLLQDIQNARSAISDAPAAPVVMQNVKPAETGNTENVESPGASLDARDVSAAVELADVRSKLSELIALSRTKETTSEGAAAADKDITPSPALEKLLEELRDTLQQSKEDDKERTERAEQHAEGLRYLNELNSWLETFVKANSSHLRDVCTNVERLCKELGCEPPPDDGHEAEGGDDAEAGASKPGILVSIQQLLHDAQAREEALKASIDGVSTAVNESSRANAEAQSNFNAEALMGMLDQQRLEQASMLKALANELSDEIRGERLRFVDAMKEATAINVQVHVEQFKKELTREVLLMTHEVGRLHKERQAMEQRIAELFAFYSKQKRAEAQRPPEEAQQPPVDPRRREATTAPPRAVAAPPTRAPSPRRPLPNPQ